MADLRRIAALGLLAAATTLSGCGGGTPDKAEFVQKMQESVGDLDAGMRSQNIDPAEGDRLITTLLECQYDALAEDPGLLSKAYDDPSDPDISVQLDTKSQKCLDAFSSSMAEAAGPTTTGATTTVPEG